MSVTRERFEQGMSYVDYKAQMTRNRERLEENERLVDFAPEDVAYFHSLTAPVHLLVLGEDWCGDVINNLPVIARLAQASDKINVRIFLRDQNLDIMDQYLKEEKYRSIPVVVAFDEDFRELGYWIERPSEISELSGKMTSELYSSDPAFAGIAPGTSPGELPEAARARMMQAYGARYSYARSRQWLTQQHKPCARCPGYRRACRRAGRHKQYGQHEAAGRGGQKPRGQTGQSQHHLLRRLWLRAANPSPYVGAHDRVYLRA